VATTEPAEAVKSASAPNLVEIREDARSLYVKLAQFLVSKERRDADAEPVDSSMKACLNIVEALDKLLAARRAVAEKGT
jgi:hypothetical protein